MKETCLTFYLTLLTIGLSFAQKGDPIENTSSTSGVVYDIVEQEAVPVGGMEEFYLFLSRNINYPYDAVKNRIEGTSHVRFVIDEQGNVISAETIEGYRLGYGLDDESIRVVAMTKWTPAMNKGVPVQQRKILPIKYKLPEQQPKKKKS